MISIFGGNIWCTFEKNRDRDRKTRHFTPEGNVGINVGNDSSFRLETWIQRHCAGLARATVPFSRAIYQPPNGCYLSVTFG